MEDVEAEVIYADDEEFSFWDYITGAIGFVQNNGWYILAFVVFLMYIVKKLWPHYLKWSKQRAEDSYTAEIKKNPDLFQKKQTDLEKARIKFQEEYEKQAKIAIEIQKEKERKKLEERQELLKLGDTGHSINRSEKSKKSKPDYNPLMGTGAGSNYRPARRSPCSGGGCG